MPAKKNKIISVMIVEDSSVVRDKVRGLLSEIENVTVIAEAETAHQAVKLGMEFKPDVMILDIKLSGNDTGFTVLKKMKKFHPDVVTIMLSNHSSTQYKRKMAELGADYFFDKSNEFEKMLKVFSWI